MIRIFPLKELGLPANNSKIFNDCFMWKVILVAYNIFVF